jgi:hypothetical protein
MRVLLPFFAKQREARLSSRGNMTRRHHFSDFRRRQLEV